jgi:hypothetical protein
MPPFISSAQFFARHRLSDGIQINAMNGRTIEFTKFHGGSPDTETNVEHLHSWEKYICHFLSHAASHFLTSGSHVMLPESVLKGGNGVFGVLCLFVKDLSFR